MFDKFSAFPAPIRIGIFLILLLLTWLPIALSAQFFLNDHPNLLTILTMGWLFILFFILIKAVGKWFYGEDNSYRKIGLFISPQNALEILQGLGVGLSLTFSLFILQSLFGWLTWENNSLPFWRLILEGSLTGIGVAFAEESFFRGWLLNELERDYSLKIALWTNGIIFAIAHFLKPIPAMVETLPAFPGLLLLGLILGLARRKNQGRLGLPIGLHGGLVWGYYIVDVGELISYTQTVPVAITGIYGNPIAGAMGWLFLFGLILWLNPKKDETRRRSV